MEAINKINNGLHLDFNPYDQPENTMRDNRNGIIMDLDDGNFMWTNNEGTKIVWTLNPEDIVMRSCWIRNRLFFIVYNNVDDYVVLYEAVIKEDGTIDTLTNKWEGKNSILNLSIDHPIRAMFGYYENERIQRIYWSDYYNPPRSVNIGNGVSVTIEEKFVNFFPEMDPVYGNIEFLDIISGGNCLAGTYFFAWRLFNEGYYTDWSYLSSPVHVSPDNPGSYYDNYQDFQGGAPNLNASKTIKIKLTDLDDDYESIQVAAFYSNDYNSAQPGVIFYDGDINGSAMILNFIGNENLGTVTISELMETSIVIDKCKDMAHIKKMNVLANLKERDEIDISNSHSQRKNNQLEVQMIPISRKILLDTTGYPDKTFTTHTKPLCGIQNADKEINDFGLIPGFWYYAEDDVAFTDDDGAKVITAGNIFQINSSNSVSITYGKAHYTIVKSKYRPKSATDNRNTWINEIQNIYTHFFNYKNPQINNLLKGYPGGETVRFGIVFVDKTGRPFYARHLYNTETTYSGYTIGPGDMKFPSRDPHGGNVNFPIIESVEWIDTDHGYKFTLGNALGVSISGIDITPIKDEIGGFFIVRAPIEREIIAYGILNGLVEVSNDVSLRPGYNNYGSDVNHYEGAYAFHCPEDLFDLSNFTIQSTDKLVNMFYMSPIDPTNLESTMTGYGKSESNTARTFYQKFLIYTASASYPTNSNGIKGAEHDIKFFTKYRLGDDTGSGIVFDPSDATKLFKENTQPLPGTIYSSATNVGIIVIDIDESSNNIKGEFNTPSDDPMCLVCAVKRPNNNPYGGLGDSSLANTTYIGTGHYQEVNESILTQIENGGRYVFNNIEVFGGDTYITLFDFNRLLRNEDISGTLFNHSIIVPIESRINIELREGRHIAKDRSYAATNLTGLRRKTSDHAWEEFNYNDGYSSENISDYYLALPYNFELISEFDTRMRHSPIKTYGELEDSYRKFNALDYLDLSSEYGSITNIKSKFNYLIYWQRDAVGYVPINERALSANSFGDPVQLGVGGIFKRYDEIIDMLGNSNQFGLIESAAGFHWYDAIRKIFVTLTGSLKLSQDSIVRGIDRFFVNDIPNNMDQYDNPIGSYGIVGSFDIRNKIVYLSFIMPGNLFETIGYNIKSGKFVGFFDYKARSYFNWKDWLYSIGQNNRKIFQHGTGTYGNYHEENQPMYFTVVVKESKANALIFDNFEYIGSQNNYTKLKYENSIQLIEELTSGNRNLKYRNKRWYGNFPRIARERLVDGYLKITFYYEGQDKITFNQLTSIFRKMI